MLSCIVIWFGQPAKAAQITFDRAYTGTISGQTFTAAETLAADAAETVLSKRLTFSSHTNITTGSNT